MWNESVNESVTVRSLAELDELVGQHVMESPPEVYWEEAYARLRFESVQEGLAAMRDPYFQHFVPEELRIADVLAEVREFPAYSVVLATAMTVVERMGREAETLHLRSLGDRWIASFGLNPEAQAKTAQCAICLAALRAKGLRVELPEERLEAGDDDWLS